MAGCCHNADLVTSCTSAEHHHPCIEDLKLELSSASGCDTARPVRTLSVKCCVCDIVPRFIDVDPDPGRVTGYVKFGPAQFFVAPAVSSANTSDAEQFIAEYRIFLANANGSRLDASAMPVASVSVQESHPYHQDICCKLDAYVAKVEVQLASSNTSWNFADRRFVVVPFTNDGIDLLIGKATDRIWDLGFSQAPEEIHGVLVLDVSDVEVALEDAGLTQAIMSAFAEVLGLPEELLSSIELQRRPLGWGFGNNFVSASDSSRRISGEGQVLAEFIMLCPADTNYAEMRSLVQETPIAQVGLGVERRLRQQLFDGDHLDYSVQVAGLHVGLTSSTTTTGTLGVAVQGPFSSTHSMPKQLQITMLIIITFIIATVLVGSIFVVWQRGCLGLMGKWVVEEEEDENDSPEKSL